MAASCGYSCPLTRPLPPLQYRTTSPLYCGQQLNCHMDRSFLSKSRIRVPSPSRRLRVVCLRDPKLAVVTGRSWNNFILESEIPVLVEFYASWCGPCRMVHRVIDEIATEYAGRVNCFVLHADTDSQVAEEYDIKAVPVVMLFKNGEKLDSVVGTMPKEFYVAAIERALAL
ncbi:hypothetical protein RJ639_047495 [Escallonia herrerae]|uniref:Thioredoxin domain-containing protein n=1 Tax=Escallonia herrerae TaxID=1293975 RepID=A0AA88W7S8_9ASTE|nr:hypothetical protein RJ639_047495 [Escallonia herrerae]